MTAGIDWSAVGSIATAVAVLVAAWQVHRGTTQARITFEDELSREYRELARGIPVSAYLGDELTPEELESAFSSLHRYFDLTNEQIFLRMNGRISKATWRNWRDGIESNLKRPAFAHGWVRVKTSPTVSFAELRRLEASDFRDDPRSWVPIWKRLGR